MGICINKEKADAETEIMAKLHKKYGEYLMKIDTLQT